MHGCDWRRKGAGSFQGIRLVCCCGAQPGAAGAIKTGLKWLNVGLLVMSQAAQGFFCVL